MYEKKEGQFAVFTVCNLAYLPKALVLAESLMRYGEKKLKIYIFDRKVDIELPTQLAEYIWIEDVGIKDLYSLAFKYDITEFSTSLKPQLTLKLLEQYEKVIFLDPDTCLYHSIDPILNDLEANEIVLTPHYITPKPDSDIGMMRFGSFNLGFYAIRKSKEGIRFLSWWNERCLEYCFFETQFGLSTDQKWVSIAPCFFPTLYVSFDLGYNVAFWNAHERTIQENNVGGYIVNNKFPLIFFHFSSFNEENPELLSKRPFSDKGNNRIDLLRLSENYKQSLSEKKNLVPVVKYGFDYMSSGEYISPTLRRAYASVLKELPEGHDPFDSNDVVSSFAKKNKLFELRHERYVVSGFADAGSHRKKFLIINLLMRIVLRVIGPNNFTNLSRLLVFLSSYRLNRDLWKL